MGVAKSALVSLPKLETQDVHVKNMINTNNLYFNENFILQIPSN